ncbi:MAG: hypothetical protein JOY66_24315 [Acetobacteraceae bacterium]|nr:hypothetical protein [Acetobacteraceae bacterium]
MCESFSSSFECDLLSRRDDITVVMVLGSIITLAVVIALGKLVGSF